MLTQQEESLLTDSVWVALLNLGCWCWCWCWWVVGGIAGGDKNVKCLNVLDGHGVDDSGVSGTGHNGIWHISIRVMLVLAWSYWDHSQTIMIMIIMFEF